MSKTLTYGLCQDGDSARIVGFGAQVLSTEHIIGMSVMRIEPPMNKSESEQVSRIASQSNDENSSLRRTFTVVETGILRRMIEPQCPTDPVTKRPLKAIQQLNHPNLGSTEFSLLCGTCKYTNADCPPHSGHHVLPWPVCLVPFVRPVQKILSTVCFFCYKLWPAELNNPASSSSSSRNGGASGEYLSCLPEEKIMSMSLIELDAWKVSQSTQFNKISANCCYLGSAAPSSNSTDSKTTAGAGASSASSSNKNSSPCICVHCGMLQPTYTSVACNVDIQWKLSYGSARSSFYKWSPSLSVFARLLNILHSCFFRVNGRMIDSAFESAVRSESADENTITTTTTTTMKKKKKPKFDCGKDSTCHEIKQERFDRVLSECAFKNYLSVGEEVQPCESFELLIRTILNIPLGEETEDEAWALRSMMFIIPKYRANLLKRFFTGAEQLNILSHLKRDDIWRMGKHPDFDPPKNMVQPVLHVPGTGIRPAISEANGSESQSQDSLTNQLKEILKYSALVRGAVSMGIVECVKKAQQQEENPEEAHAYKKFLLSGCHDSNDSDAATISDQMDSLVTPPPIWLKIHDARGCLFFNLSNGAIQDISNLQYKIGCMINSRMVNSKKQKVHNSSRTGAKNSKNQSTAVSANAVAKQLSTTTATRLSSNAKKTNSDENEIDDGAEEDDEGDLNALLEKQLDQRINSELNNVCMCCMMKHCSKKTLSKLISPSRPSNIEVLHAEEYDDWNRKLMKRIVHKWSSDLQKFMETPQHGSPFVSKDMILRASVCKVAMPSPYIPTYGKTVIRGMNDRHDSKHGRIIANIFGTRYDHSSRMVLTSGADIPVECVGLPISACMTQTIPCKVTRANIDELKVRVRMGPGILGGATKIIADDGGIIILVAKNISNGNNNSNKPLVVDGVTYNVQCAENDAEEYGVSMGVFGIVQRKQKKRSLTAMDVVVDDDICICKHGKQKSSCKRCRCGVATVATDSTSKEGVEDGGGTSDMINYNKEIDSIILKIGWTVHVHVELGDTILLNRQPTLQRGNHASHKIIPSPGHTKRLSEAALSHQNADCDGDEMNGMHGQSHPATTDETMLMNIPYNMICPRTHRPNVSLNQDSLHGAFLLTSGNTMLTRKQSLRIIRTIKMIWPSRRDYVRYHGFVDRGGIHRYSESDIPFMVTNTWRLEQLKDREEFFGKEGDDGGECNKGWKLPKPHTPASRSKNGFDMWTGKQLLSLLLPKDLCYFKACDDFEIPSLGEKQKYMSAEQVWDSKRDACFNDPKGRFVAIVNGEWVCGNGNKEIFGSVQKSLSQHIWRNYGNQYAVDVLSDWIVMCHEYLAIRGFTCGALDVMIGGVPPPEIDQKNLLLNNKEGKQQQQQQHKQNGKTRGRMESIAENDEEEECAAGMDVENDCSVQQDQHQQQESHLPLPPDLAFNKLSEERKMGILAVLQSGYDRVLAYISNPENTPYLTMADTDHARATLDSYSDKMKTYMNDFVFACTDASKNCVSLMVASGSKGSVTNSTTMSASLGSQRMEGQLLGSGIKPTTRNFTSHMLGEMSPSASGMIQNGFSSGMDEVELAQHCQPSRFGISQSSNVAPSGYQNRRLSTHSESHAVQYDGTVRNGFHISQLAYGGSGSECMLMQNCWIHGDDISPQYLISKYSSQFTATRAQEEGNECSSMLPIVADDDGNNEKPLVVGDFMQSQMSLIIQDAWPKWFHCQSYKGRSAESLVSKEENAELPSHCSHCLEEIDSQKSVGMHLVNTLACKASVGYKSSSKLIQSGMNSLLPINVDDICKTHANRRHNEWLDECSLLAKSSVEAMDEDDKFILSQQLTSKNLEHTNAFIKLLSDYWCNVDPSGSSEHESSSPKWISLILNKYNNIGGMATSADGDLGEEFVRRVYWSTPQTHEEWNEQLDELCRMIAERMAPSAIPIELILVIRSRLRFASHEMCFWKWSRSACKSLMQDIYDSYSRSFACPGEPVGIVMTQSISEPSTQLIMRVFKTEFSGVNQISHLKAGVPRLDEIINFSDSAISSMTAALHPSWSPSLKIAKVIASQMVAIHLHQWVESYYAVWLRTNQTFKNNNGSVEQQEQQRRSKPIHPVTHEMELTSAHPLFESIKCAVISSYEDCIYKQQCNPKALSRIAAESAEDARIRNMWCPAAQGVMLFKIFSSVSDEKFSEQLLFAATSQSDGASGFQRLGWKGRMLSILNQNLLPWQRGVICGGPSVHPSCPYYWCMWSVHGPKDFDWLSKRQSQQQADCCASSIVWSRYMSGLGDLAKTLMTEWTVSGYEGVEQCVEIISPTEDYQQEKSASSCESAPLFAEAIVPSNCYTLQLRGTDLEVILTHFATVDQFCKTSNLRNVFELFDIEATAQSIVQEIALVFGCEGGSELKGGGIYIQPSHQLLLADIMTAPGFVIPVNRKGLAQLDDSFVQRIAFEQISQNIINTGIDGRFDPLVHIAPNTLVGTRAQITGSGVCRIVPPTTTTIHNSHSSTGEENTLQTEEKESSSATMFTSSMPSTGVDFNKFEASNPDAMLLTIAHSIAESCH